MKEKKIQSKKNGLQLTAIFLFIIFVIGGATIFNLGSRIADESFNPLNTRELLGYDFFENQEVSYGNKAKALLASYESALNENLFLREYFVGIDNIANYLVKKQLNSTEVLLGKDNWLFYKSSTDGDSIADYQGTNHLSESEMKAVLDNLLEIEAGLKARGMDFVVMVPPNKEQVYSYRMPEDLERVEEESKTDLMVAYLKSHSSLKVVYPKEELMAEGRDLQLYYKYDSHWNQLGAYVGEQQLLEVLFGKRSFLKAEQVRVEETEITDLANMLGKGTNIFFKDDHEYLLGSTKMGKAVSGTYYRNEEAPYGQKLLFIGDSFRWSLIPRLSTDFKDLYIQNRLEYEPSVLEKSAPDIVVLEFVERYSDQLADFKMF